MRTDRQMYLHMHTDTLIAILCKVMTTALHFNDRVRNRSQVKVLEPVHKVGRLNDREGIGDATSD